MERFHKSVLLKEVVKYLELRKGEKYIDTTLGGGGHAEAILKFGGKLLAIDCDPVALKTAKEYLSSACPNTSWQLAQGNFRDLAKIAQQHGFTKVGGIIFDLGVSAYQLEKKSRGFSFRLNSPLDMRMDPNLKVTAADLVNGLGRKELDELFAKLAQEHHSRRIAEAICSARRLKRIETTGELTAIINKIVKKRSKIHPATRCFLSLRMAVNDELNSLRETLPQALVLLKPGGRLAVISFHSGEDRIVKQFFKVAAKEEGLKLITEKPIHPSDEEIKDNPRSRSARLRVGEKCLKKNQLKN